MAGAIGCSLVVSKDPVTFFETLARGEIAMRRPAETSATAAVEWHLSDVLAIDWSELPI